MFRVSAATTHQPAAGALWKPPPRRSRSRCVLPKRRSSCCGRTSPMASIARAAPGRTRNIPRLSSSARTAPRRSPGRRRRTCYAGVLRRPYGHGAAATERLRAGERRPADAPDGLRPGHRHLQADRMGCRLRRIGEVLRGLPDPNMAEFYTSGRASNEAAFLFHIFAREYGTNNFPDCSNMCHEATSVGLAAIDRHRQGHGFAGGFRPLRTDHRHGPQSRHESSAHDGHTARVRAARRADHRVQSAERARA